MRFPVISLLALVCAPLALTACATQETINIYGRVLTSGAMLAQEKRKPVYHFTKDDFVVMLVDITWPNPQETGGAHNVVWNWYKDATLLSTEGTGPHRMLLFKTTPWTLATKRAASTLGQGMFKVDTVIDGQIVATGTFDIAD